MKKRLGTLKRAKGKIEELTGVIAEQRRFVNILGLVNSSARFAQLCRFCFFRAGH